MTTQSATKKAKEATKISGTVERITFRNPINGHTVMKMQLEDEKRKITVVGKLVSVQPGEDISLKGCWVRHKKFGLEFKASSFETSIPTTLEGIEKYLGSGLIKGIGPILAARLVAKFKLDTIGIIDNHLDRLREVEGIGYWRIAMIRTAWEEHREIRALLLVLNRFGIGYATALKIYRQFAGESLKVATQDPYRLSMEVKGVGFLIADRIALGTGTKKDAPLRVNAGVIYALKCAAEDGHVYSPYDKLLEQAAKILGLDRAIVAREMAVLAEKGAIVIENVEV